MSGHCCDSLDCHKVEERRKERKVMKTGLEEPQEHLFE